MMLQLTDLSALDPHIFEMWELGIRNDKTGNQNENVLLLSRTSSWKAP